MSNIGYIVKFKKWDDPLKNAIKKASRKHFKIEDDDDEDNDFSNEYSGPVAATEFGLFPLGEDTCLSNKFNFWEGRTNFPLENYHKFLIDTTLGVETNDIKTPYRFRIAIGPLFNETDVLKRVEKNLVEYTNSIGEEIRKVTAQPFETQKDTNLRTILDKQYKFYAIVNLGTSKHIISGNTEDEVNTKVTEYIKDKDSTKINVEYSWNKGK